MSTPTEPDHLPAAVAGADLAREGYVEEGLVKAMTPVTERSIRRSVELNPQILSEALFPIMGPALRRSIAAALERMVQSLNATAANSLSPQSVRWRMEAWRTGKSFAEVVMLRTLLYRVEQVFLIEKTSGLLLQHAAVDPQLRENSDLISAMLTAIQDFVRDSFQTPDGEGIGAVSIGETTVWVETGPQAVLAGVIRGSPPADLRDVFHDTLIAIHQDKLTPLASFRGDPEEFSSTRELLEGCLRQQLLQQQAPTPKPAKKERRRFGLPQAIGLAALLALMTWTGFGWRSAARWQSFEEYLRHLPGVVLIHVERSHGKYLLQALRDPLADDPLLALPRFQIPAEKVQAEWRSYQSLDEEIVRRRGAIAHTPLRDER